MDLREKLKSESGPATWDDLKLFIPRGTLILLNDDLDIIEVGFTIATDNVAEIKKLMDNNKFVKPDPESFSKLKDRKFKCLIVDPFVLCQLEETHP